MNIIKFLISIIIFLFFVSCTKNEIEKSVIKEKSLDFQVLEAYTEGKKSLEQGDVLYAAKKFNEAETYFLNQSGHPKLH